jgi:transposase
MKVNELQVAVDVGARMHRVAVGDEAGRLLEEFDLAHTPAGFAGFFTRIERLRGTDKAAVSVAMEGYNGWARPLDSEVLAHSWKLYNVNNLKLARYKEIFPAPAKTDAIDARRILELFRLRSDLPVARGVLQQIVALTQEAERLKRLTRRRRQLVNEKVRVVNRMHSDLQAVCPGCLAPEKIFVNSPECARTRCVRSKAWGAPIARRFKPGSAKRSSRTRPSGPGR